MHEVFADLFVFFFSFFFFELSMPQGMVADEGGAVGAAAALWW